MTTANKITIIRVLLVPVFMFFFFSDVPFKEYIYMSVYIIASLTDSLDGYIARKYNQITTFGKLMDPLADKLLVTAALVSFAGKGYIHAWVAVVIISREFIVTGLRTVAISEGKVIAASSWGKIKTISQLFAVVIVMLHNDIFPLIFWNIDFAYIAVIIAVIFTIISGTEYIYKNLNLIKFE